MIQRRFFSVFPDDEFILKQEKKNSITYKWKKKSSYCLSLLGPQLHLTTLQGITITSKCQPVDQIGKSVMVSTKILSVEIGSMTIVIPPSAFIPHCTRIDFQKIVVLIFGGELHFTVKWQKEKQKWKRLPSPMWTIALKLCLLSILQLPRILYLSLIHIWRCRRS